MTGTATQRRVQAVQTHDVLVRRESRGADCRSDCVPTPNPRREKSVGNG